MSLRTGMRLGSYEIVDSLGVGGMGEVYRARDTKLGRDVAIKVLPDELSQESDRLARFRREAQVLASLNHPNIASIYGLEESDSSTALVLELVEGPTLADRIRGCALSLEESLAIAGQISEALEAAHEKGIIHRDLKPANIKVTEDGVVKVLDFGLAKALEEKGAENDPSDSPTMSAGATRAGVILGTAAYMSPEQARGAKVDRRADIWSFGVVLSEMLTGKRLFAGESSTDTLAAVLRSEIDWKDLPTETPVAIRRLIRRCLDRDRKRRLQAIGEARIAIEEYSSEPEEVSGLSDDSVAPRPAWQRVLPWMLVGVLAIAVGVLGWRLLNAPEPDPHDSFRFSINLPAEEQLDNSQGLSLALSPDGSRLVYVSRRSGDLQLYLREMDAFEAKPMAETMGGYNPFFSPDGRWVGFFADGKLKKVSVEGGSPLDLADAEWGHGSWGTDGTIIYTPSYSTGLWQVSANGGKPEELTSPDSTKEALGHWWPQVLPVSESVLFTVFSTPVENARIAVLSLETGKLKVLIESGTFARYVPTGHIVYVRTDTLMAVPFDLDRLEVTGAPVPVLEDVPVNGSNGNSQFSFAEDGSLVYIPASLLEADRLLVSIGRDGKTKPVSDTRRTYSNPRVSPDGHRLAVSILRDNWDIWIHDLACGTQSRLTVEKTTESSPVWTPDGHLVIYRSDRPIFDLFVKSADGSAPEELLLASEYDKGPFSISPDGKILAFVETRPDTREDIWLLPLGGEGEPQPFLRTQFVEIAPVFSPDGRWLAYQSNESGRNEIYVQSYPGDGGKRPISTEGGSSPRWSRDGRELFYRNGDELMAVTVGTESDFTAGEPRLLFQGVYEHDGYDVASDGRFLMIHTPPESAPRQIRVVLHWFEELRRLAPTK